MSFFKSIQFKAMLCMMVVAAVSVIVIDQVYQAWLVEAEDLAINGRIKKSLFSLGMIPENQRQAFDRLIELSRRFDLDGAVYIELNGKRVIASVGRRIRPDKLAKMLKNRTRDDKLLVLPASENDNVVWGVRTIPAEPSRRYLLAVAVSRAHGLVTRESLSSISWITLIGCVFVALFFSYLLRNTVTRPLERLSDSMIKVAHGDLSQHMSMDVDYELKVLVQEFNYMIDELRENRHKVREYQ